MEGAGATIAPILAVSAYLQQLRELAVNSPAVLILGLLAFSVVLIASSTSKSARLLVFMMLLYTGSLERPEATRWYSLELSPVLQPLSTYSRILTISLLACLTIPAFFAPAGIRKRLFSYPLAALLGLQLLNCVKIAVSGELNRFLVTFPTTLIVCLVASFAIGKTVQSYRDIRLVFLMIVGSATLVIGGTLHELVVNPSGVFANQRLYGTTSNPQIIGSLLALVLPIMLYFIMLAPKTSWMKPILSALSITAGVGIAATGSRTAALTAIVGLASLFRRNAFRMVLISTVVVTLAAVISLSIEETKGTTQRLLSHNNTRAEAWIAMIEGFLDNPAFGATASGAGSAESSYIGVAVRMGIVGLTFLAALFASVARLILKLNRLKPSLGEHASLADLVIGGLLGMGVSCMFDAYLFGSVTWHIIFLYTLLALGQALQDLQGRAPDQGVALQA